MVNSMTGYGTSHIQIDNTMVTAEVKTVNHRYLDITPKIPRSIFFMEDTIKKTIQSYFSRGKVDVYVGVEGDGVVQKSLMTNWDLLDQYVEQIKKAQERYQLTGELPTSLLTNLPELMEIKETEDHSSELNDVILKCIRLACEEVVTMRRNEGQKLLVDLKERAKKVRNVVLLIEGRRNKVIEEYRQRILERVKTYMDDTITFDPNRIHQEVALLAEKGDITEEITRLFSHLDHFDALIGTDEVIGRRLDFILQEMHRETNTIGSKATDNQIGEWVITVKSEIEKIKEQVQNIE